VREGIKKRRRGGIESPAGGEGGRGVVNSRANSPGGVSGFLAQRWRRRVWRAGLEREKAGAGAPGGGIGVVDESEAAGGEPPPVDALDVAGGEGQQEIAGHVGGVGVFVDGGVVLARVEGFVGGGDGGPGAGAGEGPVDFGEDGAVAGEADGRGRRRAGGRICRRYRRGPGNFRGRRGGRHRDGGRGRGREGRRGGGGGGRRGRGVRSRCRRGR
jgi:hypothetical protein